MCAGEKEICQAEFRATVRGANARNHGHVAARRPLGDAGAFVIQRGGIERLCQLATLGGADRRTVEPIDTVQRRGDRRKRPLAMRRIRERNCRELSRAVVPCDHSIAGMAPSVRAVGVGRRTAVANLGPPRRAWSGDRVEVDPVADPAFATPRNGERDGGTAIHVGEAKAPVVELRAGDRGGGAAPVVGHSSLGPGQRIPNEAEGISTLAGDSGRRRIAKDIAHPLAVSGTEVDHTPPGRMPGRGTRKVDVDVVFIGEVRAEHVEDIELGRSRGARIGPDLLIRVERTLPGVRFGVHPRDAGYDGVGENGRAVAARQAAPIQALAEQECILEGVIVVGGEQLVPLPGIPSNDQRDAAHADTTTRRRHPERGVRAAEQKLGARRR